MLPDGGGGGSAAPDVLTPPPGNPAGIHASASTLARHAGTIGDLAASTKRRGDGTTSSAGWTGPSSQAFGVAVTATTGVAARLESPTTRLVGVVRTYADALDTAQRAVRAAAASYVTAEGKANQTADAVNADPQRTQSDVDTANTAIRGFQGAMTTAEQDAARAWATFRAARDQACVDAAACATELEKGTEGSGFTGFLETLKGANERFHSVWDLSPSDYLLGQKLEEASRALPGLRTGAQDARAALQALQTEKSVLQVLQETGNASPANLARLSEVTKALDPALDTSAAAVSAASGLSRFTGALSVAKYGLGATAIVGDVFTMISPEDSGAMGWVDRGAAGANAALVTGDLAVTAGVFGAEATIPVAGEVLMVGTAAYLAGDYLYHHWEPFRNVCNTVADTTVSVVKDVGHAASDVGHGVANVAEDVWNAVF